MSVDTSRVRITLAFVVRTDRPLDRLPSLAGNEGERINDLAEIVVRDLFDESALERGIRIESGAKFSIGFAAPKRKAVKP